MWILERGVLMTSTRTCHQLCHYLVVILPTLILHDVNSSGRSHLAKIRPLWNYLVMNQDGNKNCICNMSNQIIYQSPCRLVWIWLNGAAINQFVYSCEENPACLISEYGGRAGPSSKTYMLEEFTWIQGVTILCTSRSFLKKIENAEI